VTETVLCYHAVSPTWDHRLSLTPELLRRQLRAMRLLGPVHVTFDDAYRNIESTVDELVAQRLPVTIFVCTGYADRGGAPLTIAELASDDPAELEQLATMSWDDLRRLHERGARIQSHCVSHPHLPELSSAEIERELAESKQRIEDEVGDRCTDLAYPFGERDARVRALVQAAGYERAYALRADPGDMYDLPRVDLYRWHGAARSLLKASVKYRLLPALRGLRGRVGGR
jgi:peptidoglycan/xylan/chitin deacetylase (PgdA/CDA1 family)